MRSSPAIAMPDSLKISTIVVALGLQIVAFWLAGSIHSLVNSFTNLSQAHTAIEQVSQIYQPPISIGSPNGTMGSGTR